MLDRRDFLRTVVGGGLASILNFDDVTGDIHEGKHPISRQTLSFIKEEIFPANSRPWLRRFFSEKALDWAIRNEFYGYCIYTERTSEIKLIYGTLINPSFVAEWTRERNAFARYIEKYYPRSFKETLFYLDLYPHKPEEIIGGFHSGRSTTAGVMELMLKDTRGILLWHQQVEDMINLFVRDRTKIMALRKDINAKRPEAIEFLTQIHIEKNLTLMDFIQNRMIRGYTRHPNVTGASVVYELLCSAEGDLASS
ncbi:MAG: hypothetical protein PHT49_00060 [Desulfovibrionales bacterium]|nr:hypothetical protein [Desulfovibrionales bacterium]